MQKLEAVLVLLAAINGAVLFYGNRRRYQLFARANAPAIAAGDMAPSRNARHIRLDATTPMSWMARLRCANPGKRTGARATLMHGPLLPGACLQVVDVPARVCDAGVGALRLEPSALLPPALPVQTLACRAHGHMRRALTRPSRRARGVSDRFYSPAQALVLVFGSLPWSLVPAIAVAATVRACPVPHPGPPASVNPFAISSQRQLWWLDDEYAALAEDRQLIFHEVYDIQLASSDHRRPVNVRFTPTSPAARSPLTARSPERIVLTSPPASPLSPTTHRPRVDLSRSRGDGSSSTSTTRERRRTQATGAT